MNVCPISAHEAAVVENNEFVELEFDLNNKEEQTTIYYDENGNKHVLTMSLDLSATSRVDENIPYGAFTCTISDTNDLYTMKCRIKGTSNPYTASLTSIDQGNFTSPVFQRIGEYEYYIDKETTTSSTPATGKFLTQFSAIGVTTSNATFYIKIYLNGKINYYVQK